MSLSKAFVTELRWISLVGWLTLLFFFQMPVLAKDFDADIGGYAVLGHDRYGAFYDEDGADENTQSSIRKVRLGVEFSYRDWVLQIDGDFQDDGDEQTREIDDAWLGYEGFGWGDIQLGRMKEPFGFERVNGFSSLATNERSLATSSFAPGRSEGLMVSSAKKRRTWWLGVFQEIAEDSDEDPARAITGRYTLAPLRSDTQTLHMGIAASWRDLRGERFQIKDRGEVYTADNVIRSPRFDADESALVGAELAWTYGPLTLVSEAFGQRVRQTNDDQWTFTGGYLQAGYLLTGEHRGYDDGEFDRITPASPYGALELVARWSAVDLRERNVGAEADVAMIGLAYYWRKTAILRVNYLKPSISGNALMADPDGDAVTVRAQFRF